MLINKHIVVVEWEDAWKSSVTDVTAKTADSFHNAVPTHTIGYLVKENEKGVQIANERSVDVDTKEESFRGVTFVPREMVRSITPFTLTKVREKKRKEVAHEEEGRREEVLVEEVSQ